MRQNVNTMALVAAAGLAATAGLAQAQTQPFLINISGATQLQGQLNANQLYADFIDVDGDTFFGGAGANIDQLAPAWTNNGTLPNRAAGIGQPHWFVSYRAVGSLNGFQELADFGSPVAPNTNDGTAAPGNIQVLLAADGARLNRVAFITAGGCSAGSTLFNINNPGGLPVRGTIVAAGVAPTATIGSPGTTSCSAPGGAAPGGTRIDIAPVDMPSAWAVRVSGTADPVDVPLASGYGSNSRVSVNNQGTSAGAGIDNLLANLGSRQLFDPANPSAANNQTVFDTQLVFAPIALVTNIGTGVQTMDQSEVRHLYATGRRLNGENLVVVTRDSGSGTRNGFNNATGLDASWGVGDNVGGSVGAPSGVSTTGAAVSAVPANIVGAAFEPSNKGGSGILEEVVLNSRLAVGNTGAPRAVPLLTALNAEVVAIRHDLSAAANGFTLAQVSAARPTFNNIVKNDIATNASAYLLGSAAVFATVGDPRSSLITAPGNDPSNINPAMTNPQAAALINNITRSLAAFLSFPSSSNDFMPGELLANQQVAIPAKEKIGSVSNPLVQLNNPAFSSSVQTAVLAIPATSAALNNSVLATYNINSNGRTPNRAALSSGTYSDGRTGNNYARVDGTVVNGGVANGVPVRNKLCGDLNGDGLRNLADASDLVRLYRGRLVNTDPNFAALTSTTFADGIYGANSAAGLVPEFIADFNADGNIDLKDLRYWADGLAIDSASGKLDRKAGYEALDNAWLAQTGSNNLFGTVLNGPSGNIPYVVGASRFDLIGSGGIARGWAPVGANGTVDAADRAYIAAQIAAAAGNGDWTDLAQAVRFDLSADVTGDLKVDQADLDAYDALFGAVVCYANCDGSTTAPVLGPADFSCFLTRFRAGDSYANCDGSTTPPVLGPADFSCFLTRFRAGC